MPSLVLVDFSLSPGPPSLGPPSWHLPSLGGLTVVPSAAFVLYLEGSHHREADSLSLLSRVEQGGTLERTIDTARNSFMVSPGEHSDDEQSLLVFFIFAFSNPGAQSK